MWSEIPTFTFTSSHESLHACVKSGTSAGLSTGGGSPGLVQLTGYTLGIGGPEGVGEGGECVRNGRIDRWA